MSCDAIERSIELKYTHKVVSESFEAFWNELDSNYVFFAENGYDWDSYKTRYLKKINQITNDSDYIRLIDTLIYEMKDVGIKISPENLGWHNYIPQAALDYKDYPWGKDILYGGKNEVYYWNDSIDGDTWFTVASLYRSSDTAKQSPYMYCAPTYFNLKQYDNSNLIKEVFNKYDVSELKGVILDLSANTEKLIVPIMLELLRHFLPEGENVIFYYQKRDIPEDRYSLSTPEPFIINAYGTFADKPLVVLFNAMTTNEANILSYVLSERESTITVSNGHSGGGGGIRAYNIVGNELRLKIYYPKFYLSNAHYSNFNEPLEPMLKIPVTKYYHRPDSMDSRIAKALDCIDSMY